MGKKYFTGLNYTLGNEDTSVEINLCKAFNPQRIFSICGSGGRALPLATDKTELITLGDLSREQLFLADLRHSTYKELSYDDFLKFWGYFPFRDDDNGDFRKKVFYSLDLDPEVRNFFEKVFIELDFRSVLYLGKWERTFQTLAHINRFMLGRNYDRIMRFDNLSDQISYYQSSFPLLKWKSVIYMLGNKSLFNALLYKGHFIEKNSPLSHFDYYFNAFNRLFTNDLAKKSFFLQLCFYGKVQSLEGIPVEATKESFDRIKAANNKVDFIHQDFVSYLAEGKQKFDFVSLSDVPSYFKGDLERDYMQKITPSLNDGAVVVVRYYLRKAHADLSNFIDISHNHKDVIDAEKVQMYDIKIYQYKK